MEGTVKKRGKPAGIGHWKFGYIPDRAFDLLIQLGPMSEASLAAELDVREDTLYRTLRRKAVHGLIERRHADKRWAVTTAGEAAWRANAYPLATRYNSQSGGKEVAG